MSGRKRTRRRKKTEEQRGTDGLVREADAQGDLLDRIPMADEARPTRSEDADATEGRGVGLEDEVPVGPDVASREPADGARDDQDRADVVAAAPELEPPAPPPDGRLTRARQLVGDGRVHEAIDMYGQVLADDPTNLKARNNLGVLFDELKEHEVAAGHFAEAARLEPENVEVLTNYGAALTSLGQYDEADGVLRRAQRLSPDAVAVRLAIGILSFRRGAYEPAAEELSSVCGLEPDNGPAHYYHGEALNRLGRFDEAEVSLDRAADLMPDDPRPFYTLGHLLDRRSMRAQAAEMYRRARDLQAE